MELFNTNQYTNSTAYSSDLHSSKNKGNQPIYDSAWDDGTAWGGVEDKAEFKIGDRVIGLSPINKPNVPGREGFIKAIGKKKIYIEWWNGCTGTYTFEEFKQFGYQRVEPTASSDDLDSSDESESDRWNPDHFDPNPPHKTEGDQLTIFLETGIEPPDPDDFKTIAEYEEAWQQWEISNSLIYAQGSASGSHLQASKSEDSNSLGLQKTTITAQASLVKDSQESPTSGTSTSSHLFVDNMTAQTSSPLLLPAPRSASRESDLGQMTLETVSPQSSESFNDASRATLLSKTFEDSSPVSTALNPKDSTLDFYSTSFPAAGMILSGKLFPAEPLERPSLEKGCSWLESPGALSSTGRSPGLNRLESSLVKRGTLQRGQVINPIFLEESFGIPQEWTNPWDSRPATELLENDEQPLGMRWTPESQRSPSIESNTYTQSPSSESEEIPENFSEEVKKDRRRGCLYKYLENKKLKDGTIASYPRVTGERESDNPKHWRWGFNWEEKIDGQWKNRSLGCIPVGAIPMIQSMQKSDVSLQEIIDFIRRSKKKLSDNT